MHDFERYSPERISEISNVVSNFIVDTFVKENIESGQGEAILAYSVACVIFNNEIKEKGTLIGNFLEFFKYAVDAVSDGEFRLAIVEKEVDKDSPFDGITFTYD